MANKNTNNTSENVETAVSSIYASLLDKRKQQKEEKEQKKFEEKERQKEEKRKKKEDENGKNLSKKERRQQELDNWKEVVIGLTGDDLEYSNEKTKKKKYRKWIDDESTTGLTGDKPKKPKKKNYQKEFDPELNMLKSIVADQNRFTNDMQKRLQLMIGPNNKDASPLNKTEVELAAVVNNSRQNALGLIREIGNLKKNIADLYLRAKKQEYDINGASKGNSSFDTSDLGLMGSSIASSLSSGMFGNSYEPQQPVQQSSVYAQQTESPSTINSGIVSSVSVVPKEQNIEEFDPNSWDGNGINVSDSTRFESTPHEIIVEWKKRDDVARFKAIDIATGNELVGCPTPTISPSKLTFNEKDKTVKGPFDESWKLEIID